MAYPDPSSMYEESNFTAYAMSQVYGFPDFVDGTEKQQLWANSLRTRLFERFSTAVEELIINQTSSLWWISNRSKLNGSMNGTVGKLVRQSELLRTAPIQAQREVWIDQLQEAEKKLKDTEKKLMQEVEFKLSTLREKVMSIQAKIDLLKEDVEINEQSTS